MQAHFVYALHAQRRKGAEAYVKRDARNLNAACCERGEHLRREVQTGRGRGHRAALLGEDRLVAIAIRVRIVAVNIRRQRDVADAIENGEEVVDRGELKQALAELAALEHFRFEHDLARRARGIPAARRWRPCGPGAPARATGFHRPVR